MKKQKSVGLSFISVVLLVITSTIGAGIFFKNQSILAYSGGSVLISLFSWIVAFIGVIFLAFSLIEVTNVKTTLGPIGWVKFFCTKYFYNCSRIFFVYIYLPINAIILPVYALQMLENAINWYPPFYVTMLLVLFIILYFLISNCFGIKIQNIQNLLLSFLKVVPIVFTIVAGIVYVIVAKPDINWFPKNNFNGGSKDLSTMIPGLAPIVALPAIFFSYDGFYCACGVSEKMANKKKFCLALFVGILIITLIYCLISFSLIFIGKSGSFSEFSPWLNKHHVGWIYSIICVFIFFSVLGVTNGFQILSIEHANQLINNDEIIFSKLIKSKVKQTNKFEMHSFLIMMFLYLISFALFFIFPLFFSTGGNTNHDGEHFDDLTLNLFDLADQMANWTSILIFGVVALSLIGCIIKRKKENFGEKKKYFLPCAIISTSIIFLAILTILVISITNLVISFVDNNKDDIKSNIANNIILLIYIVITFCLPLFGQKNKK